MLVKRIRNRGANIVVEANGEVLFAEGGDVGRWTNRFSHRTRNFSSQYAPTNKRPRWAHYGKPLKSTMTASVVHSPARMKVYAAVGSTAPHAYYVDQGTGVYAGKGPYQGKILPPWTRNSPSLYEHTWKVPEYAGTDADGRGRIEYHEIGTVTIRGQKGQEFFDKGLKRAFQSMRMRSYQVPGEGASGIGAAMRSFPTGLSNFVGNTPADGAFIAQLQEWRAWRDEAWDAGHVLGLGYVRERSRREHRDVLRTIRKAQRAEARLAARREKNRKRVARWRAEQKAKNIKKPKEREKTQAEKAHEARQAQVRAEQQALAAGLQRKFGPTMRIQSMNLVPINGKMVWQITITVRGSTRRLSNPSALPYP